jgi:hypothetical protein
MDRNNAQLNNATLEQITSGEDVESLAKAIEQRRVAGGLRQFAVNEGPQAPNVAQRQSQIELRPAERGRIGPLRLPSRGE